MKKYELAVLAMYLLDGNEVGLDAEDIAVKCEEISPGSFPWKKYKEHKINLELVGFAIRDAKKEQNGANVIGSHAKGWRLTSTGIQLAKTLVTQNKDLRKINIKASSQRNRPSHVRQVNRIVTSHAYREWKLGAPLSKKSFSQLLKINTYSSEDLVKIKLSRLENLRGENKELDDFLDYLNNNKEDIA